MNTAAILAIWPQSVARSAQCGAQRGLMWALVCVMVLCATAALAEEQTRPRPRPEVQAPMQAPTSSTTAPMPRPAAAPSPETAPPSAALPQKGPVTGQPLPRYVSLKGSEGNARRGPGLTHRIDWVFTTAGTPLRVTAEYENWRRVEDFEGFGGWVHFALLSGARYVIITQDMANFHRLPDASLPVAFQAERGVLARLLECSTDWCRVNADGQRGWAPKTALWGVDAAEVVD
jgi:SH3-like domain-containing protein